jgi:transcriptional regulator with XRE-family HTH domain
MPSDPPSVFGRHLRIARQEARLTQQDIERLTGIPQNHVSNIERGLQNPTLGTMNRLASAVGKPLDELLRD